MAAFSTSFFVNLLRWLGSNVIRPLPWFLWPGIRLVIMALKFSAKWVRHQLAPPQSAYSSIAFFYENRCLPHSNAWRAWPCHVFRKARGRFQSHHLAPLPWPRAPNPISNLRRPSRRPIAAVRGNGSIPGRDVSLSGAVLLSGKSAHPACYGHKPFPFPGRSCRVLPASRPVQRGGDSSPLHMGVFSFRRRGGTLNRLSVWCSPQSRGRLITSPIIAATW